jgi:site-specific recombinase XerD
MRASSAGRLSKDHINFAERGIAMPGQKHKSGKRKFRQGHPDVLWAWLEAATDETWNLSPTNYAKLKSLAFIRARVSNPGNVLRDSFASYLLALTKDMGGVGYLMQHTRSSTTEGYEGIATEKDAKLVLAMTPGAVARTWEDFLATHKTQT